MTANNTLYKNSGIAWIGQIPNGWEVRRLKMLSNIKRWASPRPIDNKKYFDEKGEFAWVRISDVTASNMYLVETEQQLSELWASLSVKQYPWDLFLSIAWSIGKPIFATIKCCIHDWFVTFWNLDTNNVDKIFLYYILASWLAYAWLGKEWTQLNLNIDTVGNISIPLPSVETQTTIANYLNTKTTQISEFIMKKKKLIKLLQEQKQAIIHQAVTKGIDPWAKMKDSGITWIGEIPEGWETKRMKYVVSIQTWDKNTQDNLIDWIYPFFVRSETIEKLDSYSYEWEAILTAWDWVWAWKVFHYYNWKFAFHQRVYALTNFKWAIWKYLYYFLKLNFYNEVLLLSAKSTVDSLRLPMLQNFILPLPPLSTQTAIANYIESKTSIIEQAIAKIEQEISLIEEYRTSLIYHAVTGKVSV